MEEGVKGSRPCVVVLCWIAVLRSERFVYDSRFANALITLKFNSDVVLRFYCYDEYLQLFVPSLAFDKYNLEKENYRER